MSPTDSENLFNKMKKDFLASSLPKGQVTSEAGFLNLWIDASFIGSTAPS